MVKTSPAILVAIAVVVGVSIVAVFFFGDGIGLSGEINITLPPPNAILTAQDLSGFDPITQPVGGVPVGEIQCKIKQTTEIFDAGNKIVDREESSGIAGSPFITLDLTTRPSEFPINYFNIAVKSFCVQENNIPISVIAETIKVKAIGTYTIGGVTFTKLLFEKAVSSSIVARFGDQFDEVTLTNVVLPKLFIEEELPELDFPLTIEFDVTGNIEVFYNSFPSFRYNIPIFQDDINTFVQVNAERALPVLDRDGDGTLDEFDQCPDQFGVVDNNGCPPDPDFMCPDGSTVKDLRNCPIPPPPQDTCADTNDPVICKIECELGGGIYQALEGVPVCIKTPECLVGEKLELQSGNIFVCVDDPDQRDDDGDGILNGIDACPNQRGTPENNGCPEGQDPVDDRDNDGIPDNIDLCPDEFGSIANQGCPEDEGEEEGNLIFKVIEGEIGTLTTVTFEDGTTEFGIAISSQAGGTGIQLPNLGQQIARIVPAELIGGITGGEGKPIRDIMIEIFYINNVSPNLVGVQARSLELILTVDESSVSSASSNPVPFTGSLGTGDLEPLSGEGGVRFLGTGISLGKVTVTAQNIVDLGEEANITSGQKKEADLIFSIGGFINFEDGDEVERFLVKNTFITLRDVIIDNVAPIVTILNCTDDQIEIIDGTGKVIDCETPDPTVPECFSSERPQGYACSEVDVINFCDGDPSNCTEKDLDNDGVPDYRDDCRDRTKSNLLEDGLTINGSDPDDGCSAIKKSILCNPLVMNCTPNGGDGNGDNGDNGRDFCSETNPDACIIDPEDILIIAIIGGIIIIIIGVGVAVARRR